MIGSEGVDLDVEASLDLSYRRLPAEAGSIFCLLSVFPSDFDAAAEEVVCQDECHRHLSELVRWSLVEYRLLDEAGEGRYHLHDLVRLFAAERLEVAGGEAVRNDAQQRHSEYFKDALSSATELYGNGDALSGLRKFDLERMNIEAGWAWAKNNLAGNNAVASLCNAFLDWPYLLELRLHPKERISWLETALAAARQLKDNGMEGAHLCNLGSAYSNLGQLVKAIDYYEQALKIAREIGDRRGEGADLCNLGLAYRNLGETSKAIEYHEQALKISREIGDRQGEGADLGNLGLAYTHLGEPRRAIDYYEQAQKIAQEIGDRRGEGADLGNLGNTYSILGEPRRAIEYYEQALKIAREIGDRRGEGNNLGNLGNAYSHLGETHRAIQYYDQALKIAREIGDLRGEGNGLFNMSLSLDGLGQRVEAIELAKSALEIYTQIESPNAEQVRQQLEAWQK
jgi:tetratricopeptide (TPR) repeat protein